MSLAEYPTSSASPWALALSDVQPRTLRSLSEQKMTLRSTIVCVALLAVVAQAAPCSGTWPPPSSCTVATTAELLSARDLKPITEILLEPGTYTLADKEEEGLNLWRSVTIKASTPGGHAILQRAAMPGAAAPGRVVVVTPQMNVLLEGLTIRGGWTKSENGAGILNRGNLTLKDCVVTDNLATGDSPEGMGGGISIYETSLTTLINTTVTANKASTGAGGVDIDQGTCTKPCAFFHMDDASKVIGNLPDNIVPPP